MKAAKLFLFGIISMLGSASFIMGLLLVTRGHESEWITLILAPLAGVCLATVMHFADIDFKFRKFSFRLREGQVSLRFDRT